jgi:hypothetical protein
MNELKEIIIFVLQYCAENKAVAGLLGLSSLAGLIFSIVTFKRSKDLTKRPKKAHSKGNKSPAIIGNDTIINYGCSEDKLFSHKEGGVKDDR